MKRKIYTSFHRPDLKFIFRLFRKRIFQTEADSSQSSRLEVWAVQSVLAQSYPGFTKATQKLLCSNPRADLESFPRGGSLQGKGQAD